MAFKFRENEISRQIQNVMTSLLVSRENFFSSDHGHIVYHSKVFIADHFLLKDLDLKNTQKRNF